MELPNIGKQCTITDCKQLDFLPLKCSCEQYFCSEHFYLHANECVRLNNDFILTTPTQQFDKRCSITNCKNEHQLLSFECSKCKKYFCIEHRYHSECFNALNPSAAVSLDQKCADLFKKAHDHVDQVINTQLKAAMKKPTSSCTAIKVNLMRLKGRAKGDSAVPINERVYFTVCHGTKNETTPVYLSRNWSVGRGIDFIAKMCNLKNNNNVSDALKLRLFKKVDDVNHVELITNCMSDRFDYLLKQTIISDGYTLYIDYVDSNNQSIHFLNQNVNK